MSSMTATQANKAARGTKRVCHACQVRFYDLLRDPILCPACGERHVPEVRQPFELGSHKPAGKTGWRHSAKRTLPVEPAPDVEVAAPAETADAEELEVATEEVANASAEDDTVLVEQDGDDADFTGLVEVEVEDPKEG